MDLTDTKGYRAKYINALNEASKRHRIVGGDVTPLETDGGTLLRIPALAETCRFQLFVGATEILDKPITPTFCVADGSFFVAGELIKLKSCTNTMYKKEGICPTSSGWALKAEGKDGWKTCDVEILKYEETYYLGFHFDNEKRYPLISDTATEDIESQISVVVKIGTFNAPINDTTLVQIVKSDIFYGGGGGVSKKEPDPFEVKLLGWTFEGDDQSGKDVPIIGIRNGTWLYARWVTKAMANAWGVNSSAYPKFDFYRLTLDAHFDGSPIVKDQDGNEFFNLDYYINQIATKEYAYIKVYPYGSSSSKDLSLAIHFGKMDGFGKVDAYSDTDFLVAEIYRKDVFDYVIRTYTGDITDVVKDGGVRLYSKQNATGSGEEYVDAYGTQFDANKEYVLASKASVHREQKCSVKWIQSFTDAFNTLIPCTSHAVDHLGGIV